MVAQVKQRYLTASTKKPSLTISWMSYICHLLGLQYVCHKGSRGLSEPNSSIYKNCRNSQGLDGSRILVSLQKPWDFLFSAPVLRPIHAENQWLAWANTDGFRPKKTKKSWEFAAALDEFYAAALELKWIPGERFFMGRFCLEYNQQQTTNNCYDLIMENTME